MTTLVINKEETFSMIFTPEMPIGRGRIIKTQEAYKMAMDAIKAGTAQKTGDTSTTLMYKIK